MLSKFIGIPFKDKDCFQLTREVYQALHNYDMLQTEVKHYESEKIAKAFMDEATKWFNVPQQKGVIVAIKFDPRHPDLVTHFGVMVDNYKMLHTTEKTGSVLENVNKYLPLVEGFYRHYK